MKAQGRTGFSHLGTGDGFMEKESCFKGTWYHDDGGDGANNVSSITEHSLNPGTKCFAELSNPHNGSLCHPILQVRKMRPADRA